jgi:hypothetical protein
MNQEFTTIAALLVFLQHPQVGIEAYCRLGVVSSVLAAAIKVATGLDAAGFTVVLDRSGIQHTFRKHGLRNAASELAQGQIPIEDADFEVLPEWLLAPDSLHLGQARPGKQPMPCIELRGARPDGLVSVILEYRPGRRRLVLTTMYKKRPTT